jgi:hypothetical protein
LPTRLVKRIHRLINADAVLSRRSRQGEPIPAVEMIDFHYFKAAVLAAVARELNTPEADEIVAAARRDVAELERAGLDVAYSISTPESE